MQTFEQIRQHLIAAGWKEYKDHSCAKYQYPFYYCRTPKNAKDCCLNEKAPLFWIRLDNFHLEFPHAPDVIGAVVEITGELPNGLWLRSTLPLSDGDVVDSEKMEAVESLLVAAWNAAWDNC